MGMQGGIGGTHLTPITLSPQVAPQAQEGAERGRPHRAASHRSGDAAGLGGPCPPVKGVSRAGWHFYASCGQAMLCPRVPSPGLCQWCRIPSPRVLGYPAPGLLPSPRNGSTNPPPLFLELLAGQAPCPASSPPAGSLPAPCHLLLGPLTQATSWGAPTGCSDALGCCGQGLGRAPPHLYLLQRETIYREIYIFKLIFKDLFLSLWPRPAAQSRQRGGTSFAGAVGGQSGGTHLVHAPQLHGVLGGHRQFPTSPILAAPCLSFPTSEHRRDGDWGCA